MRSTRTSLQRRRWIGAAAALCSIGAASALHAQPNWPAKPIRIVVSFAAGGTTDVMARVLAKPLSEALGQPVFVGNKPGASGDIAAAEVMKSPADGYTLLLSPTTVETANPSLSKSSFHPSKNLTPVAGIGRIQLYLVAKNELPVKDAKELIALAKANPDKLSYGSAGAGTTPHLAGELFKQQTGVSVRHVPYRGAATALQDVLSGHVDYVFDPGIAFSHVRAGKVKMLAVASGTRSPFFPDVPTLVEVGYKGAELDTWFGVWAPQGTPADIVSRVRREMVKALALPQVKSSYSDLGAEPIGMETAELRKLLATETKLLTALIKERQIIVH